MTARFAKAKADVWYAINAYTISRGGRPIQEALQNAAEREIKERVEAALTALLAIGAAEKEREV